MKKTVVLGITSGIAAYKTLDLINALKQEGLDVFVIMTAHAAKMISPAEVKKASGHKVFIELFEKGFNYKDILKKRRAEHIDLADKADVMVVAPATASLIAKVAHGLADDFLTTTILATTVPVIFCPSMNVHMWQNPIVQENIARLKQQGYYIIHPGVGRLACGYDGKGRLPSIETIKKEILDILTKRKSLHGKRIMVTAGATTEKIDEVRYITNRSSGKMGVAIAEECFLRGAEVLLLKAKNSVEPRFLINEQIFQTADELLALLKKNVKNYDAIFHTAAISDFKIENPYRGKLKSRKGVILKLKPQAKIIDKVKLINPSIRLIAFKAEYGLGEKKLIKTAVAKLQESKSDAVVANDISLPDRGFGADTNEVYIVLKDKSVKKIPLALKRDVAKKIIEFIFKVST